MHDVRGAMSRGPSPQAMAKAQVRGAPQRPPFPPSPLDPRLAETRRSRDGKKAADIKREAVVWWKDYMLRYVLYLAKSAVQDMTCTKVQEYTHSYALYQGMGMGVTYNSIYDFKARPLSRRFPRGGRENVPRHTERGLSALDSGPLVASALGHGMVWYWFIFAICISRLGGEQTVAPRPGPKTPSHHHLQP